MASLARSSSPAKPVIQPTKARDIGIGLAAAETTRELLRAAPRTPRGAIGEKVAELALI